MNDDSIVFDWKLIRRIGIIALVILDIPVLLLFNAHAVLAMNVAILLILVSGGIGAAITYLSITEDVLR